MFKKFRDRKYLFIPQGKSNLTSYDRALLCGFFFAHLSFTASFMMWTGWYWKSQDKVYKEMTAHCHLSSLLRENTANILSEIKMQKMQSNMENQNIGVSVVPLRKPIKSPKQIIKNFKK